MQYHLKPRIGCLKKEASKSGHGRPHPSLLTFQAQHLVAPACALASPPQCQPRLQSLRTQLPITGLQQGPQDI